MSVPATSAPARASSQLTFLILAVSAASFSMLQSLLAPVLPTIQRDLGTTQSTVTWVLTAWLLSAAIATPLLGKVGDMVGKKRTLVLALGAVAVGSLFAALAPSIGMLLVGRVIQGLGGAMFPLAFGIIRDEFPRERVTSAIGTLSAVIAVGGGLGTVLAGPIVSALSWRWLFWIPMIVVLVMGALALRLVPESPVRSGGRINFGAAGLLAAWLVALLLPLSEGPLWGWTSARTLGLFALAAVLIASWITVEIRSANPVIDMRMMRLPAVWTANLVALLFGAGMFAIVAFLPQFTQMPASTGYGFGDTITESGLIILPMLVTMAVAGTFSGSLPLSFKSQLVLGSALSAVASAGFAFFHAAPWQIAVASGIFGLGLGLAYAAMTSLVVQSVPPAQTGIASGMNANVRTIGGAIGTAVVSSIVTGSAGADGLPTEGGYTTAFILLTLVAIAAGAVALLVPNPRRSTVTVLDPTEDAAEAAPVAAEAA